MGVELIYLVLHEQSLPGDPEVGGRGGSSALSSCFLASFCTPCVSLSPRSRGRRTSWQPTALFQPFQKILIVLVRVSSGA